MIRLTRTDIELLELAVLKVPWYMVCGDFHRRYGSSAKLAARLLELQAADTMADQLRHRRETLAEREQVQASKNELLRWNEARTIVRRRMEELAEQIAETEQATSSIDQQRERLQAQLKTVIAPREAEALQSEITAIDRKLTSPALYADEPSEVAALGKARSEAVRKMAAAEDEWLALTTEFEANITKR